MIKAMPWQLEGEIRFRDSQSPVADSDIYVRLEDVSRADGLAISVAEQVMRHASLASAPGSAIPFSIEVPATGNWADWNLRVHVDVSGSGTVSKGDHVTVQSYPIRMFRQRRMIVEVHLVR